MKIVSVEELVSLKMLPFDLYNENGEKIFNAGEVLTPGKLLQLRYISVLYRDEEQEEVEFVEEEIEESDEEETIRLTEDDWETEQEEELFEETEPETDASFENEISFIPVRVQKEIKSLYKQALDDVRNEGRIINSDLYIDARDMIIEEVLPIVDSTFYKSQMKVYGDYDYSHGINVAILSTVLGYKMKLNEANIRDIALGAMLHDIGKTQIPIEILEKAILSQKEIKLIQLHSQVGYKMIKKDMGLGDHIAKIALEHHERNDGSGYPYGISGDLISLPSQIVIVCDVYDRLTSNRGHIKVKNSKEAVRVMLDIGSKWFTPSALYTFVHMTNYNDTTPLMN